MISTWISHYLYLICTYYDHDLLWYTKDHFTSMSTSALHTYWIMNAKNLERWQGKQQHCTLGNSLEGLGMWKSDGKLFTKTGFVENLFLGRDW